MRKYRKLPSFYISAFRYACTTAFIACTISCGTKATSRNIDINPLEEQADTPGITITETDPVYYADRLTDYQNLYCDDQVYVNAIEKFSETGEIYFELSFRPDIEVDWSALENSCDSVIWTESEDIGSSMRKRLPSSLAIQYFDLSCMSVIQVYSIQGKTLYKARLTRVELYDQELYSSYIAVFRPESESRLRGEYAMAGSGANRQLSTYKEFVDDELTGRLLKTRQISEMHQNGIHYSIEGLEKTISVVPVTYPESYSSPILMFESDKATIEMVFESDEIHFDSIIPTRVWHNGRPVFLAYAYVPESCGGWWSALAFNGTAYEFVQDKRIRNSM